MGSANAATIMDLLSAVMPKAVLFLGKCGGLKRANVLGDYVLPIAAIRGEGTSNEYLPPEVPSLPAFQCFVPFLPPYVIMERLLDRYDLHDKSQGLGIR